VVPPCYSLLLFVNPDLILDFPVVYFFKIPDLVRSIADLLFHLIPEGEYIKSI
jgi:hypothetical protein